MSQERWTAFCFAVGIAEMYRHLKVLTAPKELIIKMLPFSPPLDTTGLGTFDHGKGCSSYLKHYQRKCESLCLLFIVQHRTMNC